jgi:hypothetical protein
MGNPLVVDPSIANDDNLTWSRTLAGLISDVTDSAQTAAMDALGDQFAAGTCNDLATFGKSLVN